MAFSLLRRCMDADDAFKLQQEIKNARVSSNRFCPICSNKLREVCFYDLKLHLEACSICQFIWFDKNEYDGLYDPQSELQSPRVPSPKQIAIARTRMFEWEQVIKQKETDGDYERDSYSKAIGLTGMPVETGAPIKNYPWVTWMLCALVAIVGTWSICNPEISTRYFAMIPSEALRYFGMTLITSFFIHANWFDLWVNFYFLLLFADNIEDVLGYKRLLITLGCATTFGFMLEAFVQLDSDIPVLGASGGISGLLVFYTLNFPKARLSFFYFNFAPPFNAWIVFTPKAFLLAWLIAQIKILTYSDLPLELPVYTHAGGAMMGSLFWWLWGDITSEEGDLRPKISIQ